MHHCYLCVQCNAEMNTCNCCLCLPSSMVVGPTIHVPSALIISILFCWLLVSLSLLPLCVCPGSYSFFVLHTSTSAFVCTLASWPFVVARVSARSGATLLDWSWFCSPFPSSFQREGDSPAAWEQDVAHAAVGHGEWAGPATSVHAWWCQHSQEWTRVRSEVGALREGGQGS